MKKLLTVLLLSLFASPVTALADSNYSVKPGKWEITVTMLMPGMPFTPPPRTFRQCVTPEQASLSMKKQMQKTQKSGCEVESFDFAQGEGHWKVSCHGRHAASGEGWVTINSDKTRYTTKTEITLHDTGGGTMTIKGDASWIGNCTP